MFSGKFNRFAEDSKVLDGVAAKDMDVKDIKYGKVVTKEREIASRDIVKEALVVIKFLQILEQN